MRILITGVAGHLGSALARWIRQHHPAVQITGVDNLSTGFRENVPPGVDFFEQDVLDGEPGCRPPLWQRYDVVYHFAAFASEVLSPRVRQHTVRNVLEATAAVINHCQRGGVGRLVFTSSIAAYGRGVAPFPETAPCQPVDTYGVCKAACEREIGNSGLEFCIVRPHNIYGPGQNLWDDSRNVFGIWMRQAIEGNPLRIYGDGLQRRAFTFIDDILEPLWLAGTAPAAAGQVINLGGSEPVTILHAAELTAGIVGARAIEHRPAREEVRDAWATAEKSARLLAYRDATPLAVGVARMWDWARMAYEQFPERRPARVPPLEVVA